MRNLKKFLALVLALMMVVSVMVTVSAADIKPDAAIKASYQEAVDVLSALDLVKGDENGVYKPEGNITRGEFAAMLYRAVTGDVNDEAAIIKEMANYDNFSDVDSGLWYAGYINYVYANDLMKGDGSGNFMPMNNITGYEVLVSLLRALGYDKMGEFTNNDQWRLNAATFASRFGVSKGVTELMGSKATRQEVAQLVFNTLTNASVVVYQPGDGGYSGAAGGQVTLGELNFDNLHKFEGNDKYADDDEKLTEPTDPYGKPLGADKWVSGNEFVAVSGTPAPVVTYTNTVKDTQIEKDLKGYKVKTTDGEKGIAETNSDKTFADVLYKEGDAASLGNNKKASTLIADNVKPNTTVTIYADKDKVITHVVVVEVKADLVFEYGTDKALSVDGTGNYPVADVNPDLVKDDVVLYTVGSTDGTAAGKTLVTAEKAPSFVGTMSEYKQASGSAYNYVIDGETYTLSPAVADATITYTELQGLNGKADATYYIGPNDTIVYAEEAEDTPSFDGYGVIVGCVAIASDELDAPVKAQVKVLGTDGKTNIYNLPITVSADKKTITYKVAGADVTCDQADSTSSTDLTAKLAEKLKDTDIYSYKVDADGNIILAEKLTAMTDAATNHKSAVVSIGLNTSATIDKKSNAATYGSSLNAVINSETVFILQKHATDTSKGYVVKTGPAALEGTTITQGTDKAVMVVSVDAKGVATVKYVFTDKEFISDAEPVSDSYVYVDGKIITVEGAAGKEYYVDAVTSDGEIIRLGTKDNATSAAVGVWTYNVDNKLEEALTDTGNPLLIKGSSGGAKIGAVTDAVVEIKDSDSNRTDGFYAYDMTNVVFVKGVTDTELKGNQEVYGAVAAKGSGSITVLFVVADAPAT